MVFFVMAGPGLFFGGNNLFMGGMGPGAIPNRQNGASALFSFAMVVVTFMFGSRYPLLVTLVPYLIHCFPDQFSHLRNAFVENPGAIFYLITFVFAFLYMGFAGDWDVGSEEEMAYAQAQQQRFANAQRQAADPRSYASRGRASSSPAPSRDTDLNEMEGSWGGSVVGDFILTMLLLLSTFMLPQLWVMLNRWLVRVLPESGRASWLRYTSFLRPSGAAPGTMPTSRDAINKLENLTLEERHLLMENSPGGIICPVCLDPMHVGETVKRLPCKHLFHPGCVLPWLEKHNSCPTCRYELETSDPTYEWHRQVRAEERERQQQATQQANTSPSNSSRETPPVSSSSDSNRNTGYVRGSSTTNLHSSASAVFGIPGHPSSSSHLSVSEEAEFERLLNLTIPELRAIARRQGVNLNGAIEKREVVSRIMHTQVH